MAEIESHVVVNEALIRRLQGAPQEIRKKVRVMMRSIVLEMENRTKRKLSNQVLHVRSNRLRSSIDSSVSGQGIETVGRFGVMKVPGGKPLVYAAIHEFGGLIPAHRVEPKTAQALRFVVKGKVVFSKYANIPPVTMKKRSYIRSTAKEGLPWVRAHIAHTLSNIINGLAGK